MSTALIIIAVVYGACLLGTALINMGEGAFFFIGFVIFAIIIDRIYIQIKERKKDDE